MQKSFIIFLTVIICQRMQNITQNLNPNNKNSQNNKNIIVVPKHTQNLRHSNKPLKHSQFWYEYTIENM